MKEKNKIKFLGTGGVHGVPLWNCDCKTCVSANPKNKRLRSSLFVALNDKNIIIDFGQDFGRQLVDNKIKKIDYAFLTHAHRDHMGGAEQFSIAGKCIIEAPKDVLNMFFEKEGGSKGWLMTRNPDLVIRPFEPVQIGDFMIDSIKLKHQKDYVVAPVPCYGYLFKSKKFSFAYMSDYNEILEEEKLHNLDLIISDASEWDNIGRGHVGVKGAIKVYQKLKPKQMLLTHIGHKTEHNEVEEYVKQFGNISVAYDRMEITI